MTSNFYNGKVLHTSFPQYTKVNVYYKNVVTGKKLCQISCWKLLPIKGTNSFDLKINLFFS